MRNYRRKIGDFVRNYEKAALVVAIVFLVGILTGGLASVFINSDKLEETRQEAALLLDAENEDTASTSSMISKGFKKYFLPLGLMLFFGFFAVFIPFIFAQIAVKGAKMGFSVGVMVRLFRGRGFGYALCSTVLQNMIFIPFFVFLAVFSIKSALRLKKARKSHNKRETRRLTIQNFCVLGVISVIALLCGIFEGTAAKYILTSFFGA